MQSKIQAELALATEVEPKSGETIVDQAYMKRLAVATGELGDKAWDKLSADTQDWANEASDAINAKKDVPVFVDLVKPAEEPTQRRRRAAEEPAEPAAKAYVPKKGDKVKITTKRGTVYEGTVTDPDDKGDLVIDDGTDEIVFKHGTEGLVVEQLGADTDEEPAPRRRRAAEEPAEPAAPPEPEVGDTVEVRTKRGKLAVGNIVEIDDEALIIKTAAGEEEEFDKARVESITVKVKNAKAAPKAEKGPDPEPSGRKTTKEDNGGVAVTTRAREVMCDDLTATKEDVMKQLKKEGLEFKENTINLIYSDVQKLVRMLRERKLMK
jgi:small nuclear ribonucleoprotein (snRNP)-like protein